MGRLTKHTEKIDNEGNYFCRVMNTKANDAMWLCENCPLCGGVLPDESGVVCVYSDEAQPDETGDPGLSVYQAEDEQLFPDYAKDGMPGEGMYAELPIKAIKFAAIAHKGAFRKGNGLPYIIHPMETMSIVSGMTEDPEVIAAAALHDVIEDTPYTYEDIEKIFGENVANLVGMESEDKKRNRPAGETWRERKEENLEREKDAPLEAKMIMLADKLSNLRATMRDFKESGDAVWEKFNMKDKSQQEWYYRQVAKVVQELSDTEAYREYTATLDHIF